MQNVKIKKKNCTVESSSGLSRVSHSFTPEKGWRNLGAQFQGFEGRFLEIMGSGHRKLLVGEDFTGGLVQMRF